MSRLLRSWEIFVASTIAVVFLTLSGIAVVDNEIPGFVGELFVYQNKSCRSQGTETFFTYQNRTYGLTARHCILHEDNPRYSEYEFLIVSEGKRIVVERQKFFYDRSCDLAIFKVSDHHSDLLLDKDVSVKSGDVVSVCGFSGKYFLRSTGNILSIDSEKILHTAVAQHGMSGGPLIVYQDGKIYLVGVLTGALNYSGHLVYTAIPRDVIISQIEKLNAK